MLICSTAYFIAPEIARPCKKEANVNQLEIVQKHETSSEDFSHLSYIFLILKQSENIAG